MSSWWNNDLVVLTRYCVSCGRLSWIELLLVMSILFLHNNHGILKIIFNHMSIWGYITVVVSQPFIGSFWSVSILGSLLLLISIHPLNRCVCIELLVGHVTLIKIKLLLVQLLG